MIPHRESWRELPRAKPRSGSILNAQGLGKCSILAGTVVPTSQTPFRIDASLFKAYDIRGIVERSLTREAAGAIGAALGSEAHVREIKEIAVGRDGRLSGPWLRDALIDGIRSAGVGVVDIGQVATPILYFATYHLATGSGVEITGSHNPPDYNGMKFVLGGASLHGEGLQVLRRRIEQGDLYRAPSTNFMPL